MEGCLKMIAFFIGLGILSFFGLGISIFLIYIVTVLKEAVSDYCSVCTEGS